MDKESKIINFTAASGKYPLKVVLDAELKNSITNGTGIIPIHIQFFPTNICNLHCPWCSCEGRNRKDEMDFEEIMQMITLFKKCGTKAVTITGGGEPLMHKRINEIIDFIHIIDMKMGLVTNGTLLNRVQIDFNKLVWVRISMGDKKEMPTDFWTNMEIVVNKYKTDWSFSYVLTPEPDYDTIANMINFANTNHFTHVRLVTDILETLDMGITIQMVKDHLKRNDIPDSLVIYQDRTTYTSGTAKCKISLLKPVINADGNLFPCCGTQYALENPGKKMEEIMCMGHWKDIVSILDRNQFFDGSVCVKCYYNHYNELLDAMTTTLQHKEFL